jgi:hypothetical protein
MLAKVFLGANALLFIGYGLVCLSSPSVVADQTGMQLTTGVASAEVRAMYGGLQTSVGLLALLGLTRPGLQPAALLALVFVFFGLASGRMLGILVDTDPGVYNFGAFVFEAVFGVLAMMLLSKGAEGQAQAAG